MIALRFSSKSFQERLGIVDTARDAAAHADDRELRLALRLFELLDAAAQRSQCKQSLLLILSGLWCSPSYDTPWKLS